MLHSSSQFPSSYLSSQVFDCSVVVSSSIGLGEDVLKIEEVEVEVDVLVDAPKILKEIVEALEVIVEEDKDPFEVEEIMFKVDDRIGDILEVDKDLFWVEAIGVPETMST